MWGGHLQTGGAELSGQAFHCGNWEGLQAPAGLAQTWGREG